ncbi:hypothetical protein Pcinc_025562 [Petrolisthes cinctipes]|uniref:RanBP2-type domain-containing protein n=1 Tax=Petrolisthes cinctipes TaxID=88211 RepID=A0AAE1F8Z9_PETCI|nr:hypothetical protein Pcinc_025562 [Petrolisthes cinctipes]
MLPKSSKRRVKEEKEEEGQGGGSSGEEGRGAASPKRKKFSSERKDRKYESEDSMEDTKDTNDWGGGWDRHSDYDSGSRDRYSRNSNVKPGDWECTSCQFNNFASRTACFKCRAPKDGDSSPFGGGGRMGGGGGGGGGGMRDMRPGDWCCPKCQFHNFSSRAMCYKCNSSRGGGGDDRFSSPRGMSRPGEWDCPRCQFSNFSHRDYCFKCRTPRVTYCVQLLTQHISLQKVDAPAAVAVAAAAAVVVWMAPGVACVLETGSATSASSITSLHAISASSARPPNDLYFSPPREHLDQDKLEWRRWNTTGYLF